MKTSSSSSSSDKLFLDKNGSFWNLGRKNRPGFDTIKLKKLLVLLSRILANHGRCKTAKRRTHVEIFGHGYHVTGVAFELCEMK